MNCCDYDCHQGRDCPARSSGFGKIGRKEHGREPLRGAVWRRQLKYLATAMLLVLAVMLVSAATVALIANWHPDVPPTIQAKRKEA